MEWMGVRIFFSRLGFVFAAVAFVALHQTANAEISADSVFVKSKLETDRAVTRRVTSANSGVITPTGSDGTVYKLTIPRS
jgi:hypothetical protein